MNAADRKSGFIVVGFKKLGDKVWFDRIVTIDETDIIAGGEFDASITSGGLSTVFLMKNYNTLVFFGVVVNNFRRVVSGTVVN